MYRATQNRSDVDGDAIGAASRARIGLRGVTTNRSIVSAHIASRWPVRQQPKDLVETLLGVDAVQAARSDQREEGRGALGMCIAAVEHPCLATHDDFRRLRSARVLSSGRRGSPRTRRSSRSWLIEVV